jgi:hypothetical protein
MDGYAWCMDKPELATEPVKTALENSVTWFLSDKLQDAHTPIATKKFLTNDNLLIYITHCSVADASVPRVKVQVFRRVTRGVREEGYQLWADHRFNKYVNEMIFGASQGTPAGTEQTPVDGKEAAEVLALVNNLGSARQTL